jgi:Protein of unknown function (DUF3551)
MRLITVATLLIGTLAGSSAFAQHVHHKYCRLVAGGTECAYDTLAQCQASRTGQDQSCVLNSAPINH